MSDNIINSQTKKIITDIINTIYEKNINISDLCEKLYLTTDQFIDLINNPLPKISVYFEIFDMIESM